MNTTMTDPLPPTMPGGKPRRKAKTPKSRLVSVLAELADGGWKAGIAAGWDGAEVERVVGILVDAGITMKNLAVAYVAVELLAIRQPDTVRGVMYSVVSAGWLPDTGEVSYGRIQRMLNSLRKSGVIPFAWVVDNIRSTVKPSSWTGLEDFAETVAGAYRKDFWASLPVCVEVIVEKDTVAGRIAQVTREYDVALHPLRGYSSTTFTYQIGNAWNQIQKPIFAYYIGDHDPSGRDIERSIRHALTEHCDREFSWERLAVTPDQFEQFDIIALQPKKKDQRYSAFTEVFGDRCAEVEAVPADALRAMVKGAIEQHIDADAWERLKRIENEERTSWNDVMRQIRGVA